MTLNIAIAYYSAYGHTARQAEFVAEGVKDAGAAVALISVDTMTEVAWDALDAANAIIFGAPTYMGGVPAPFKAFIDSTSKRWMTQRWKDKVAAGFTNSGNENGDKLNTLLQLMINAMQHSMIWVGTGIMPSSQKIAVDRQINRFGSFVGLMAQSGNDTPDITPPAGDLETARIFGKRVAEVTGRLQK